MHIQLSLKGISKRAFNAELTEIAALATRRPRRRQDIRVSFVEWEWNAAIPCEVEARRYAAQFGRASVRSESSGGDWASFLTLPRPNSGPAQPADRLDRQDASLTLWALR